MFTAFWYVESRQPLSSSYLFTVPYCIRFTEFPCSSEFLHLSVVARWLCLEDDATCAHTRWKIMLHAQTLWKMEGVGLGGLITFGWMCLARQYRLYSVFLLQPQ